MLLCAFVIIYCFFKYFYLALFYFSNILVGCQCNICKKFFYVAVSFDVNFNNTL